MYQIKLYSYMHINNDFVIDHRELIISILCYVRSSYIITKRYFFCIICLSYATRKLLFTLLFTVLVVISNMTLNCAYLYIVILWLQYSVQFILLHYIYIHTAPGRIRNKCVYNTPRIIHHTLISALMMFVYKHPTVKHWLRIILVNIRFRRVAME